MTAQNQSYRCPGFRLWLGFLIAMLTCLPRESAAMPTPDGDDEAVPLLVFVSILPQAYFVEQIGGERVTVEVLVGPGQSPASYDPTPKQMTRLAQARVYFAIGVPMERSLLPHLRQNFTQLEFVDTGGESTVNPVTTTDAVPPVPGASHQHSGDADPHTWLDPRLAAEQSRIISETLSRLDNGFAALYQQNSTVLQRDLQQLDGEVRVILEPVAGKEMLVFHPAFEHFTARYGLKQVAIEQGGLAPSPRHLTDTLALAQDRGIRTLFVQPQFANAAAGAIARETGFVVISLDPLARDYLRNLREMAVAIRDGLRIN